VILWRGKKRGQRNSPDAVFSLELFCDCMRTFLADKVNRVAEDVQHGILVNREVMAAAHGAAFLLRLVLAGPVAAFRDDLDATARTPLGWRTCTRLIKSPPSVWLPLGRPSTPDTFGPSGTPGQM
jgi:hypothetical protein